MRAIRTRTIGSVTIAVAMALTACTSSDSDPVASDSPSPSASASAETDTPADDASDTPDVEQVDGEVNGDLPETNPQGMTAAEARAAGWNLHPELPDNTEILVDLRTHRGYGDEPVTPEIVPSLWDPFGDGLDEKDVNKALDNEKQCLQDYEFTYELERLEDGTPVQMMYDCEYTGTNTVGDTGKPVQRVRYEDIFLSQDGNTVEVDNIMCDLTAATAGCPDGDFTITVTDDIFAVTFRGFDRSDGTPTLATKATTEGPTSSGRLECRHDDPSWFGGEPVCALVNGNGGVIAAAGATDPFDVEWADEETVTLTYPLSNAELVDSRWGDSQKVMFQMQVEDGTTATFDIQAPNWIVDPQTAVGFGSDYDQATADAYTGGR